MLYTCTSHILIAVLPSSALRFLFLLLPASVWAQCDTEPESQVLDDLTVTVEGAKVDLLLENLRKGNSLTANLGFELPELLGQPADCSSSGSEVCWQWGEQVSLQVAKSGDDACYEVTWESTGLSALSDCFELQDGTFWYGGGEDFAQRFPLSPDQSVDLVAYVPGDSLSFEGWFGGVAEPWWINSDGVGLWVRPEVPLFYSWDSDTGLCVSARNREPYVAADPDALQLAYSVCVRDNAKEIQLYGAQNLLGLPEDIPDERMLTDPVWSTWAEYKTAIDQETVLQFAQDIRQYGFRDSQLEIDDDWETCYGEAVFDEGKFPDAAGMVQDLKNQDFRVTLWIHPFINIDCPSWAEASENGYLIKDRKSESIPGLTYWWQGAVASGVDFTNADAVDWWTSRLDTLRSDVGIDSFKFDAGESTWLPQSYSLSEGNNVEDWPGVFTTSYATAVGDAFGGQVEVRVGRGGQRLPIFVRMLDKYSRWGYDNGLATMVTSLLQIGFSGYPFVLPDMIGGNGYGAGDDLNEDGVPEAELYVRWLQANALMPAMQFSYVPWGYGEDDDGDAVVAHAVEMADLHASYADTFVALAEQAVADGSPINRPIWWIDPQDDVALAVEDEYLLGDDVLVAPVLESGATSRDVYLPAGPDGDAMWRDANTDSLYIGGAWIRSYQADLYTLPYFIREN